MPMGKTKHSEGFHINLVFSFVFGGVALLALSFKFDILSVIYVRKNYSPHRGKEYGSVG
ncbi:hypothetical protein D3C76_1583640 [compost metagenome]